MNKFVAAVEALYPDYEVMDVRFMLQNGANLPVDVDVVDQMFAAAVERSYEVSAKDLLAA